MTAFPPLTIANEVLREAGRQGKPLTIMQLLKLVYMSHGWSLALLNSPLVDREAEAWQHGPVYPEIYREFRRFGARPITDFARNRLGGEYKAALSSSQKEIIRSVVDGYGSMHAFELSAMTHRPETPWSKTYRGGKGADNEIPDHVVQEHYQSLAERRTAAV